MIFGISIHALLAESDSNACCAATISRLFLSTLSLRRATYYLADYGNNVAISIHALLAESDDILLQPALAFRYFYPRSPCGERLFDAVQIVIVIVFLSTLSLRRATLFFGCYAAESRYFYPRSPCGERRGWTLNINGPMQISIHALLAESDSKSAQNSGALLRIWNKFYGDCIFMLTGKAVFYPFCPCFFHIFWCEGSGNFMIAFPSH